MKEKLPDKPEDVANFIDGKKGLSRMAYMRCVQLLNEYMNTNRREAERLFNILERIGK